MLVAKNSITGNFATWFVFGVIIGFFLLFNLDKDSFYGLLQSLVKHTKAKRVNGVDLASLAMDDPRLISFISEHFMLPPSPLPYNLSKPNKEFYSQYSQGQAVAELFNNTSYKGNFFEAGAYNGEDLSCSLYFEKTRGWTGLLVEPLTVNIEAIKSKHRKATLVTSCISGAKPSKVIFRCNAVDKWGCTVVRPLNESDRKRLSMSLQTTPDPLVFHIWCFPLYSILLAAQYTEIDYMILDLEFHEYTVLSAVPFDKVKIKVIQIEVGLVNHSSSRHDKIRSIFKRWPMYKEYRVLFIDILFVNTDLMTV